MKLDKIEKFLTFLLEAGEISRGKYAELMEIDRCDVDDKINEIKERIKESNPNQQDVDVIKLSPAPPPPPPPPPPRVIKEGWPLFGKFKYYNQKEIDEYDERKK